MMVITQNTLELCNFNVNFNTPLKFSLVHQLVIKIKPLNLCIMWEEQNGNPYPIAGGQHACARCTEHIPEKGRGKR